MSITPEVRARIQGVEDKLAELDPILHRFCELKGYTFSSQVDLWPRRRVWARQEIDRVIALSMDLTVPEVMERGFYPEMPWSLYADASCRQPRGEPLRILGMDVFRGLAFSQLAEILEARIEDGWTMLQPITCKDIIARGQVSTAKPGNSQTPFTLNPARYGV